MGCIGAVFVYYFLQPDNEQTIFYNVVSEYNLLNTLYWCSVCIIVLATRQWADNLLIRCIRVQYQCSVCIRTMFLPTRQWADVVSVQYVHFESILYSRDALINVFPRAFQNHCSLHRQLADNPVKDTLLQLQLRSKHCASKIKSKHPGRL